MSRTVAESAAAYRKRRAEKMARYEAALEQIANAGPYANPHAVGLCRIARQALNQI